MKKFLCLLLAAVLAGLLILPCAAAEPTDFTDRSTIRNYNAVRMQIGRASCRERV